MPQKGDNSCLFHGLEYARSRRSNSGWALRHEMVTWMRMYGETDIGGGSVREWVVREQEGNGNRWYARPKAMRDQPRRVMSLDAYCDRMRRDTSWGDQVVIRSFVVKERISVIVHAGDMRHEHMADGEIGRVHLRFSDGHYDVIEPV